MDTIEQITDRQLEVARLIAEGRSNPEIADVLGVSLAGAKYHVSELLGRLGVSSREEVAEWYRGRGSEIAARPGWRERARMLAPLSIVLGAVAGAVLVAVALSGGRGDSGLPIAAITETATAVPTEPAPGSRGIVADPANPDQVINYCWLGGWQPGIWPARKGMLQPSYFPDGWRIYTVEGGPADWDDPVSDCSFTDLRITLAPEDAPPINSGETVEGWIAFTQTPLDDTAPDITTDEPVQLSNGRVAFRSIVDGAERLTWEQDGFVALLVSPSVQASELARIADSTALATTSPKIPLFWEYEVQPNDTPEDIAARFGVSVETVIANNIDIAPTGESNSFVQILTPGTVIRVPTVDGILHTVEDGDTVASVAEQYDADERDIVEFRANGVDGASAALDVGSLILVPGGTTLPPRAIPTLGPGGWVWPVEGDLMTPFGPDQPVGIDIRVPVGTEVRAAQAGTVTFVGDDPCCDARYHAIIGREGGFETFYANVSGFQVVLGASVNAGDVIGTVSMTAETDEPHLHFGIRRSGVYQDPMNFLP